MLWPNSFIKSLKHPTFSHFNTSLWICTLWQWIKSFIIIIHAWSRTDVEARNPFWLLIILWTPCSIWLLNSLLCSTPLGKQRIRLGFLHCSHWSWFIFLLLFCILLIFIFSLMIFSVLTNCCNGSDIFIFRL